MEFANLGRVPSVRRKAINSLAKHCIKLKSLILNRNPKIDANALLEALPSWPLLTQLSVFGLMKIDHRLLLTLAQHNTNLYEFSMGSCSSKLCVNDSLQKFFRSCKNLRVLNLARARQMSDETIKVLCHSLGEELLDLDLAKCSSLSEECLIGSLSKMSKLEKLRLPEVTDKLIQSISESCTNLKDLFVPKNAEVTSESLSKMLENCKKIREIFASHWKLTNETLWSMLHVKHLRELYISGDSTEVANKELSSIPIENLLNESTDPLLPHLELLEAAERSPLFTDKSILSICSHCPSLISLNISSASLLSSEAFDNIAFYLTRLKKLYLSNTPTTNSNLVSLTKGLPYLQTLLLNQCKSLTADCVPLLLFKLKNLSYLNVADCPQIQDFQISTPRDKEEEILLQCRQIPAEKLRSSLLEITFQRSLVTEQVLEFVTSRCLKLEQLNLGECKMLSESALISSFKKITKLQNLTLDSLAQTTTNKVIDSLTSHCTQLTGLRLVDCQKLEDESIHKLLSLPLLRVCVLSGCTGITDNSVLPLINHQMESPFLQMIELNNTKVSKETVKLVQSFLSVND